MNAPWENRSSLIHGNIHTNGAVLDDEILADVDVRNAIDNQGIATKSYKADFVVIALLALA
jgi:glutamate synthase (ferredoxin)